ncbi:MAG: hypothetical protein ACK5TX_18655 [Planctomyces sp.]|jgi:hypothetical protein
MSKRLLSWVADPGVVRGLLASGIAGAEIVHELRLRGWGEDRILAAGVSIAAVKPKSLREVGSRCSRMKMRLLRDSAGRPIVVVK